MLYERDATGSVNEVCEKLTRAAAENDFGVLGVLDLKQKMAEKGVEFGPECRIVEVCNPRQAKFVLEALPSVSTVLPCRIAVYEHAGKVVISAIKPTALMSLFGSAEFEPVAQEIEEAIIRIMDAACA